MDLNLVQIIWNITQDIELKQTPNWQFVCSFSVATNRNWVDWSWVKQEIAEFHNIVFWGKLAEILNQYSWKGKKIYIEWRLQTRSWEAQDWTKRYKTEIIWEKLILLWWKNDGIPDSDFSSWPNISNDYNLNSTSVRKTTPKKEEEITIDDIPF